ncbi:TetR/AcrR family transcriptional regulator [Bacillus salipaludis]|uniref:TetR/AcrR family transcriptional regulator n=1 Tax=Bacillus salipaludis TaxID=2547811 RepID=A0A4R5VIF4_9BACI|nr:TetR/AcrR family transcriptional regulator [Bacillus salipaludis]MDQ6596467.1 TetR/AcrR family transcriptional regulator [Bacillus salipaludis]TDK54733.1 TetR/AcrR family transcriptional regulator [Bacillus salipaludis]
MKERIINETIHQIHQKGFTFTISDLAKQLAVSKRTIYEHFSSKDELITEVINRLISQIKEKEKQIAENEELDLLEKIKQILICIPTEFELMDIRLLSDLKRYHYNQWVKLDQFLKEEWSRVLLIMEKGIEDGYIKPIYLPLFIELYLGAINQIYDPKFLLKHQFTIGEMLQSIIEILLYGILNKK